MPVAIAGGVSPSNVSATLREDATGVGAAAVAKRLCVPAVEIAAPASAASFRKSLRVVGLKAVLHAA
jgi:hypothetical protein